MIIGISGSHGTGKTTFLYNLAHELKVKHPDKTLKIINEIIRDCPFPIFSKNNQATIESQMWAFGSQIKKEMEAKKNDIVLMDRTIFDVVAYTMEINKNLANDMLKIANHLYYDLIYFIRPKKNFFHDDGQRSLKSSLQIKIDENLRKLLYSSNKIKEIKIIK